MANIKENFLLLPLCKSDNYYNSCKGDKITKSNKGISKELIPNIITNDNFTGSNREKYNIAIAIFENQKINSEEKKIF